MTFTKNENRNLYVRQWNAANREKQHATYKRWYDKNREYVALCSRLWREKHPSYTVKWARKRRSTNLDFRLKDIVRSRFIGALKYQLRSQRKRTTSVMKLLGCSIDELKTHLETQFEHGMTWDNHSLVGWHIDHKKPLALFDFTNPEEIGKAFHFKNLQPLWAKDNHAKGKRFSED